MSTKREAFVALIQMAIDAAGKDFKLKPEGFVVDFHFGSYPCQAAIGRIRFDERTVVVASRFPSPLSVDCTYDHALFANRCDALFTATCNLDESIGYPTGHITDSLKQAVNRRGW
jgi:hypothetical protein